MSTHTITLSDGVERALMVQVAAYNKAQGLDMTIEEWMLAHLQEIAVADTLQNAVVEINKVEEQKYQTALQSAIDLRRSELIADLDEPGSTEVKTK